MKLTQINNPVALRRDTTVGTRIFAGATMIYGFSGRRILHNSTTLPPTNGSGAVYVTRSGELVTLEIQGYTLAGLGSADTLFTIPRGFTPAASLFSMPIPNRERLADNTTLDIQVTGAVVALGDRTVGRHYLVVTYQTNDVWPTILPGLPA